jgi:hypothetical protein
MKCRHCYYCCLIYLLCPLNVSCCQEGWAAFFLAPFRRPRASQYCTRSKVDEGWLLAVD